MSVCSLLPHTTQGLVCGLETGFAPPYVNVRILNLPFFAVAWKHVPGSHKFRMENIPKEFSSYETYYSRTLF